MIVSIPDDVDKNQPRLAGVLVALILYRIWFDLCLL